jgi:hypothetical protein
MWIISKRVGAVLRVQGFENSLLEGIKDKIKETERMLKALIKSLESKL